MTDLVIGLALLVVMPVVVGFGAGWALAWLIGRDTYEPRAAEAPRHAPPAELRDSPTELERIFAGQFEPDGSLIAPPDYQPPIAAGSDLDRGWHAELDDLVARYRAGEPIERGAPRERL